RYHACHGSDVPCLPSRSALFTGRFGIATGTVAHAGARAEPYPDPQRRFFCPSRREQFPALLALAGHRTATISSFADRHSAHHLFSGFRTVIDPGGCGHESLDAVLPPARAWLQAHAGEPDWFLHVNLWDVHVPYASGRRFGDDAPGLAELAAHLAADRDLPGRRGSPSTCFQSIGVKDDRRPEQPHTLAEPADLARALDGLDSAVQAVDGVVGELYALLEAAGVAEETAIVISADHGEAIGDQRMWFAHNTAVPAVAHIPMIVRLPGATGDGVDDHGRCYQFDIVATLLEQAGITLPDSWHGRAQAVADGRAHTGRSHLVCSQLARCVQRAVYFDQADIPWVYLRTWHTRGHALPPESLHRLDRDPICREDLIPDHPELATLAQGLLREWVAEHRGPHGDPLVEVLAGRY
ncbi:MAG: sulfatase-like hydrolase/transferase, partial [Planctomycetota bacterium]